MGKKVIMNESTRKNDLCPKCNGNSSNKIQERKQNQQKILKG